MLSDSDKGRLDDWGRAAPQQQDPSGVFSVQGLVPTRKAPRMEIR